MRLEARYRSQMRLSAQVAAVSAPPDKEKSLIPYGDLESKPRFEQIGQVV
jgi:hypothetical protein